MILPLDLMRAPLTYQKTVSRTVHVWLDRQCLFNLVYMGLFGRKSKDYFEELTLLTCPYTYFKAKVRR